MVSIFVPKKCAQTYIESDFFRLLYQLNLEPVWRELIQRPTEDDFMRDVELLLRCFAMLIDGAEYQPSMVRFLDNFSGKAKRALTGPKLALIEQIFREFLKGTADLPAGSFAPASTNRFSIALFELAFYGVARPLWEEGVAKEVSIDSAKLQELSKGIEVYLQEGTTKQVNVHSRLSTAKTMFAAQP